MASFLGDDDSIPCKVVLNDEDQYSIWPIDQSNPAGWRDEGFRSSRRECLEYIERVWTDMTPRSLRAQPS